MQTRLKTDLLAPATAEAADRILRSCVHCGFCNATCPTYQILGDELDGPRGRIYLMKSMFEGEAATEKTRGHLDRCLTCRACETTCPSGVDYSQLLDIARGHLRQRLPHKGPEGRLRRLLGLVLPYSARVRAALKLRRRLGFLIPRPLRRTMPDSLQAAPAPTHWPAPRHARRMLILNGCVQPVTHPQIDVAAATLFDRLGISVVRIAAGGCCGAASHHLGDEGRARQFMLANINAWWPEIERAEAIIATSSACSLMLREYPRALRDLPDYHDKARRIAAKVRDISEVLMAETAGLRTLLAGHPRPLRLAVHNPCTLQHGVRPPTGLPQFMAALGYEVLPCADDHLCCGAAGTYAVLQPALSATLLENKLAALQADDPQQIVTANIGCLIHLQGEARVPVQHWIERLEADSRR